MKKRKENKKVKRSRLTIIGSFFIIIGIFLLYGKPIYDYFIDRKEIIKIEEFYEKQEEIKQDIKLEEPSQEIKEQTNNDYISVIKIPKINLEKGLCSINSNCNNVNKNIEILKESSYPNTENGNFILAGHSGDSNVSYFKDVDKLSINDEIFIYYGGYEYKYKIVNIYDIEKTGIANIIRNKEKSTLTLITCRDKTDRQIIVISELTEKN